MEIYIYRGKSGKYYYCPTRADEFLEEYATYVGSVKVRLEEGHLKVDVSSVDFSIAALTASLHQP